MQCDVVVAQLCAQIVHQRYLLLAHGGLYQFVFDHRLYAPGVGVEFERHAFHAAGGGSLLLGQLLCVAKPVVGQAVVVERRIKLFGRLLRGGGLCGPGGCWRFARVVLLLQLLAYGQHFDIVCDALAAVVGRGNELLVGALCGQYAAGGIGGACCSRCLRGRLCGGSVRGGTVGGRACGSHLGRGGGDGARSYG